MNSDSVFYIGKSKKVCADYAIHGPGYAVISDGCSSSPDTDWGSRLITLACSKSFISEDMLVLPYSIIQTANKNCLSIGLPSSALDATLLSVTVKDDNYQFKCFGDGVFAKIRKDGSIVITEIEFISGAPFYLSYQLSEERRKQYLDKFGYLKIIKEYTIKDGKVTCFNVTEDNNPNNLSLTEVGSIENYLCLAVMSDGILSFQETVINETSKSIVPCKIEEIFSQFLGFKNYFGSFVQRRVQAFKKECDKKNQFPTDDVSIGAVYCGP